MGDVHLKFEREKIEIISQKLWEVGKSLKGLGALLEQQVALPSYSDAELFGLGQLLRLISDEILKTEENLRSVFPAPMADGEDEDFDQDSNKWSEVGDLMGKSDDQR